MEKHQVDAYISGHDHSLHHYHHRGVHYYISGMGEVSNWNTRHLNDNRNPPFLYYSIMPKENLGTV